jgi:hypothetical protein
MNLSEEEELEFLALKRKRAMSQGSGAQPSSQSSSQTIGPWGMALEATKQALHVPVLSRKPSEIVNTVGQAATQFLEPQPSRPYAANVALSVPKALADSATSLASQAITPEGLVLGALPIPQGIKNAAKDAAVGSARRALGFTKRFLPNKFARAGANEASEIALQEGIVRPMRSAEDMARMAQEIEKRSGKGIETFLDKQNEKLPVRDAVKRLTALRPRNEAGQPLRGGHFAEDNSEVAKAIRTIKAFTKKSIPGKPTTVSAPNHATFQTDVNVVPGKPSTPWRSQSLSFKDMNQAKGKIQDAANYMAKTNDATMAHKTASEVRKYIDSSLGAIAKKPGANPNELKKFLRDKKVYGAMNRVDAALNNRLSSEMGNNVVGLRNSIAAAGLLASGKPVQAAATLGILETLQRGGMRAVAPMLYSVANSPLEPLYKTALVAALQYRKRRNGGK